MIVILFVCTANIARSPIAEALFNKKLTELGLSELCLAQSAGTWAVNGIPAAIEGQKVMQEWGLDTSAHRSRVVSREIINTADLILTMEEGQKEALRVEFPEKMDIIWLLSEMADLVYSIPDPYGMGSRYFKETAIELENILEKSVINILNHACPDLMDRTLIVSG